jgi:hypothetical protein
MMIKYLMRSVWSGAKKLLTKIGFFLLGTVLKLEGYKRDPDDNEGPFG